MATDERRERERDREDRENDRREIQPPGESSRAIGGHDRSSLWGADPFGPMRRVMEQMDRWFSDMGPRRQWRRGPVGAWTPQVETFQRGDRFVIHADLPGLRREDVKVEIADDAVTIEGERRDEQREENRDGYYRSERTYGAFYRAIPIPEGAIPETAKANFNNGVLEITIEAPPREVARGRRIEIGGPDEADRAASRQGRKQAFPE